MREVLARLVGSGRRASDEGTRYRRLMWGTAAVIAATFWIDPLLFGPAAAFASSLRATIGLIMIACGFAAQVVRGARLVSVITAQCVMTGGLYVWFCSQAGLDGTLFASCSVVPLSTMATFRSDPRPTWGSIVGISVAAIAVLVAGSAGVATWVAWGFPFIASSGFALYFGRPKAMTVGSPDLEEALSRFTSALAHELGNPLLVAGLQLDMARGNANDPEELKRRLSAVQSALVHVTQLLGDLRLLSPASSGGAPHADVSLCVENALTLVGPKLDGVSVVREFEQGLKMADIPSHRLTQVLVNLVLNAADAIRERKGTLSVRAMAAMGAIRIAVEDDGPGLPPDVRRRLFQPFVSTKASQGRGLGLFLSRELIRQHRGTMEVSDRTGGGACFVITLPVRA